MEARVQGGKVWGETRIAKMLIIAMPFAIVGTKFSEAQFSAEELKPWQYCNFAKESQYFSLPRQQVIAPDSMFSVLHLLHLFHLEELYLQITISCRISLQVLSPRQKTKAEVKSPPSRTSESWRVADCRLWEAFRLMSYLMVFQMFEWYCDIVWFLWSDVIEIIIIIIIILCCVRLCKARRIHKWSEWRVWT